MGDKVNELKNLYGYLSDDILSSLGKTSIEDLDCMTEIRIRKNMPVMITLPNGCYFLCSDGTLSSKRSENIIITDAKSFDDMFMKMCNYSYYSVMDTLKHGYLTLQNGSRVGVCSTLVKNDNEEISVKDITALNIRIPRQVQGCSDKIFDSLFLDGLKSVIIASKVCAGKTTLLRDIARKLSYMMYKVTIVDERNEIAGKYADEYMMDIGINTDVLTYFPKKKGIEIATRVMSPDVIVFDEIASENELDAICESFASGVKFVLSIHCGSADKLSQNPLYRKMILTGEFSYTVFINDNYNYEILRHRI